MQLEGLLGLELITRSPLGKGWMLRERKQQHRVLVTWHNHLYSVRSAVCMAAPEEYLCRVSGSRNTEK